LVKSPAFDLRHVGLYALTVLAAKPLDPHDAQQDRPVLGVVMLLLQAEYPSPDTRQCHALQPAAVRTVQASAAA